jgi:threonine synthase
LSAARTAGDVAYLDPVSGETFDIQVPRWRSDAGRPMLLTDLPGIGRDDVVLGERSLWRYRRAMPVDPGQVISLGEGMTPLVPREINGARAFCKLEWFNPSGSFKDRGAAVMLSLLRAQGVDHVLEDSSGNGGAAIATYAAAGRIQATIFVPESTSPAKTVQALAAGAIVRRIPGSRQDCAEAAEREAEDIFYASHNWHPFFLHGTKTLAYELWEDFGFATPDAVIIPCGAGSNVLGCHIGFSELIRAGAIRRMPKLFAVQPANVAPIAAAFQAGRDAPVATPILPTIAEGTAIARPLRLREVVAALHASGGGAVTVTEAEIAEATLRLARAGLYVEPTCATAAAAHARLLAAGTIDADALTVLVLTGTGLKATARIAELLGVAA